MATKILSRVFKLKSVSKTGLKVAANNANEQKSSGDERLRTDDLLLNDEGKEGAKNIGTDKSKLLTSIDPQNSSISGNKKKLMELLESTLRDKSVASGDEKKIEPINNYAVSDSSKISDSVDSTSQPINISENHIVKTDASFSEIPPQIVVEDATSSKITPRSLIKDEMSSRIPPHSFDKDKTPSRIPPHTFDKDETPSKIPPQSIFVDATKEEAVPYTSSETTKVGQAKPIGFTDPTSSLNIMGAKELKNTDSKESSFNLGSVGLEKKKNYIQEVKFLDTPVTSCSKSSEDVNRRAPSIINDVSMSHASEPAKIEKLAHEKEPLGKKTIPDFIPNFDDATPDRRLNIGRTDPIDEEKPKPSRSYFLEKSETEEGPIIPYKDLPKKAAESESSSKSGDVIRSSDVAAGPDLISPQSYSVSSKPYDFNTMESIINTKNSEKHADKYHLSKLNKAKILSKPFPVDALDPLSIPGYTPSLSEKPILPKDFIKFTVPATITSYDLVPGPSLLKTVGNIWKYIPLLGTQFVATSIYSMQSLISSYDRRRRYPNLYPYYYLLNKYGPMVRLHGPIGADILVIAVNGLDFPLVHIKSRVNKRQSLFDSLNTYRRDATPLSYMLNFPKISRRIPDNPTLHIDQHYDSLERITDDFIKRKRFVRTYTGAKEDDSHGNDLLKWAMQCTMDVYFKSKRDYMEQSGNESSKIVESFVKASKSVRLCETGIQLWRAFTTLTWLDLAEYCKDMDRFIVDEVSHCMTKSSEGKSKGSVVELLLATEELTTTDLLTPLLDLLIININMAATTAGFLLYNLSKTPQVQRTLFREVSSVLPKGKGNINQLDLAKLKYLNACITETLRMVPPFPVLNRQIEEDTKIHSFQIPKGTFVQMVNVLPCARGDICYDDIGRFQAERWTDKTTSLGGDPLLGLPQWQSAPKFNRDLIITQVALLVAKVVREYRIEYPNAEVFSDGMVLQGPSVPFNFAFIERVI